jgi:hypothetical protein
MPIPTCAQCDADIRASAVAGLTTIHVFLAIRALCPLVVAWLALIAAPPAVRAQIIGPGVYAWGPWLRSARVG